MINRYENVDVLRGIAILIIVIYHCFAITAPTLTSFFHIDKMIGYGGEIGVTLFFVLSGFGIECSILNKDKAEGYTWKSFMQKRMKRIIPQYYICLIIMLFLTDWASFLVTKKGLFHICTHLLFVHNLLPDTHGSINGAMWSLATIVQFYCIALLLHKIIKKNRIVAVVGTVIITILIKMIFFNLINIHFEGNGVYYFVYGRQLITALDNFVIGMAVANICADVEVKKRNICFLGVIVLLMFIIYWIVWVDRRGLYSNTVWGWCWHSVLALAIGILVYFLIHCPSIFKPIRDFFCFIANIEYGIYIWHIVIIYNLVGKSPTFKILSENSFILFVVGILLSSIFAGYLSTMVIDNRRISVNNGGKAC